MSPGEAITLCLIRCSDTSGRAGPAEFWWFHLALEGLAVFTLGLAVIAPQHAVAGGLMIGLLLPAAITVTVRRLHDLGLSGLWAIAILVPGVGLALAPTWLRRPGQPGPNRFGPQPSASLGEHLALL